MQVALLDLRDAHGETLLDEFLAVGIENFLWRAVGNERALRKKLFREFRRIDSRDAAQPGQHFTIKCGRCRRGEAERVGNNSRAEAHRHTGCGLQSTVKIFARDQRAGRADRFIEITNRFARNQIARQAMVVDHLSDFRFFNTVDRLRVLVVINQREANARRIDEVGFGNHACHFPRDGINHRKQILVG